MTALESVIKKLTPTGVYSLAEGSNVYNELNAYCTALDAYRESIDLLLQECFISTSQGYGLELREKVIGDVRDNYSLEKRREMLCLRNSLGENDYTVEGLGRFMKSFGVDNFQLVEMYWQDEVSICIGGSYSDSEAAWIENQICLILPAHLYLTVYFGGLSWQIMDNNDWTYEEFEARDYTWSELHAIG